MGWVRWMPPVEALIKVLTVSIWWAVVTKATLPCVLPLTCRVASGLDWAGYAWVCALAGRALRPALRLGLQLWDTLVWLSLDRGRNQVCSVWQVHSGLAPGPTAGVTLGWLKL